MQFWVRDKTIQNRNPRLTIRRNFSSWPKMAQGKTGITSCARKRELGDELHPLRKIRPALSDGRPVTNAAAVATTSTKTQPKTVSLGGRKCSFCKGPNHLAKVCRVKRRMDNAEIATLKTVDNNSGADASVHSLSNEDEKIWCDVDIRQVSIAKQTKAIASKAVRFCADTGAMGSTMTEKLLRATFPKCKMLPTQKYFRAYIKWNSHPRLGPVPIECILQWRRRKGLGVIRSRAASGPERHQVPRCVITSRGAS